MPRQVAPLTLVLLISSLSLAQRSVTVERPGPNADLEITVHVIYPNDHHAGEHITVLLEAPTGGVIAEAFTNSEGKAIFANVRPGLYVIRVRDQSIEETATGILNLENERKHHEYIRAEPRDGSNASLSPPAAKGKIPGKAEENSTRVRDSFQLCLFLPNSLLPVLEYRLGRLVARVVVSRIVRG